MLAAALTLSLCVISALPGGQPRMDAMTYNIDTLPARDLRPVVDGPETEADYTPPAQAIHTAAQEEATAEVSAEVPAPEAPAREKTESAAPAQPAQPVSSTSVLAVGVTADSVRLRAAANTGSAILAELNRGTAVSVLGRQDGWYKVNYDGKTGYMSADYVTARSSAGDLRCVARVISDGLNLRSGAAASGAVLATVSRGEYVDVSGFENGWFRVQYSGKTGYMSGDHLTLAAARPAAPAPAPAAPTTPAAPASGTGRRSPPWPGPLWARPPMFTAAQAPQASTARALPCISMVSSASACPMGPRIRCATAPLWTAASCSPGT